MIKNVFALLLLFFATINLGIAQLCDQFKLKDCKSLAIYFANKEHTFNVIQKEKGTILETTLTNGAKLTMLNSCNNDTMFLTREDLLISEANGTFFIYGVQTIPMHLKVGDKLPSFKNMMISAPISKEDWTLVTTAKSDYIYGGRYGSSYITSTIKTFNVKTKTAITLGAEYIEYVGAKVVAEEKITISGIEHTAYKIEYDSWMKTNMDVKVDYKSEGLVSADENKQISKQEEKMNKLVNKNLDQASSANANKEGYAVIPKTDWFIPGIGIVKSYTYNTGRMFEKDKAYYTVLTF